MDHLLCCRVHQLFSKNEKKPTKRRGIFLFLLTLSFSLSQWKKENDPKWRKISQIPTIYYKYIYILPTKKFVKLYTHIHTLDHWEKIYYIIYIYDVYILNPMRFWELRFWGSFFSSNNFFAFFCKMINQSWWLDPFFYMFSKWF